MGFKEYNPGSRVQKVHKVEQIECIYIIVKIQGEYLYSMFTYYSYVEEQRIVNTKKQLWLGKEPLFVVFTYTAWLTNWNRQLDCIGQQAMKKANFLYKKDKPNLQSINWSYS